jgi:hypothetical protein
VVRLCGEVKRIGSGVVYDDEGFGFEGGKEVAV